MHHHGARFAGEERDRRDVVHEVELEISVEGCVDQIRPRDEQERIAVRGRVHDRLGCDVGAGTCAVLDDELLTEPFRQPLSHQTPENVRRSAGCKTNDQEHRPGWIILRLRQPR
jgi:hypothetical protein